VHCLSYSRSLTPNIIYSDFQVELNPTMSCLEAIKSMEEKSCSGLDLANSSVTLGDGDGTPSAVASLQQPAQLQTPQTSTTPPLRESMVSMPVEVDDCRKELSRTATMIHRVSEKISATLNISVYPDDTDAKDQVLISEGLMEIRMESEFPERFRLKRSPTVSFHGGRGSTLMVSDSHSNLSDYDDDDFNDESNDELFSQDNSIGRDSMAAFSTPEASPSLPGISEIQDPGASQSDLLLGLQGHESLHCPEEDDIILSVSIKLLSSGLYLIISLTIIKRTPRIMKTNHLTMNNST
jgi:hypothetical protein